MKKLIYIALAVVLLAGCRSSREAARTGADRQGGAADSAAQEPQREYSVVNFTATVQGISANGQMRLAQDSAIWVSVTKLLEVGRALATVDSVWVSAPVFGIYFAGNYRDLSKRVGRTVTFAELQQIATSPDAEQRIVRLATELGFDANVAITGRRRAERLTFPFRKTNGS